MLDSLSRLSAALADHYLLERQIGSGGMATVYLARELKHDREVALKVLRPEIAAQLGADRFLNEVKITARLDHPHILTLIDSGASDGFLWYVQPYVRGESLRARLLRDKQLGIDEAVAIARQIAGALEHAHHHGIIHRDIKPENILLHEGEAMVSDFGVALDSGPAGPARGGVGERLTGTGITVGTPHYMSPEQAAGERTLDARTDVYSLGCVLYELLAGEMPYSGPNAQAILARRLSAPAPSLRTTRDLPAAVERTVARALARAPADRYATAAEFAEALQSIDAPARPILQRRWLAAAVVVLMLAGVAAAIRFGAVAKGAAVPAFAAVLPFADLSEGKDQEYFSDGLTDE